MDILNLFISLIIIFFVLCLCVVIFKISIGITIKIVLLFLLIAIAIWAGASVAFILGKLLGSGTVDWDFDLQYHFFKMALNIIM